MASVFDNMKKMKSKMKAGGLAQSVFKLSEKEDYSTPIIAEDTRVKVPSVKSPVQIVWKDTSIVPKKEVKKSATLDDKLSRIDVSVKDIVKGIEKLKNTPDALDFLALKNKPPVPTYDMGMGKGVFVKGGASGTQVSMLQYNLSSALNGVLKTFTIPSNSLVLGVWSSSSPGAFNPTTDYTYTSTSITFTSEINAATTLATGQTVFLIYIAS